MNIHDKGQKEDGLEHSKHGDHQIPNTYVKDQISNMCLSPQLWGTETKIPGVCWPGNLLTFMIPGSVRDCLKKRIKSNRYPTINLWPPHTLAHVHTCTHSIYGPKIPSPLFKFRKLA